jgi:DNA polymerase-3 subunit gamma/tau
VSHAYLFVGSRGTGKTTCAKLFAKAGQLPRSLGGKPMREVRRLHTGVDEGTLLDVHEIDAASNNGVDNIRASGRGGFHPAMPDTASI